MTQGYCIAETEATIVASIPCLAEKQNHKLFETLLKQLHHQNQNTDAESSDFLALGFPQYNLNLYQSAKLGMAIRVMGTEKAVSRFLDNSIVKRTLSDWMSLLPQLQEPKSGSLVFVRDHGLVQHTTVAQLRTQVKKNTRYEEKIKLTGGNLAKHLSTKFKSQAKLLQAIEELLKGKSFSGIQREFGKTYAENALAILRNRSKHSALSTGKHLLQFSCVTTETPSKRGLISTYGLSSKPSLRAGEAISFAPWSTEQKQMLIPSEQHTEDHFMDDSPL